MCNLQRSKIHLSVVHIFCYLLNFSKVYNFAFSVNIYRGLMGRVFNPNRFIFLNISDLMF